MAAAGSGSPGPEEHYTCADKHAVDHKRTPECAKRCGVRESNRCWVCGLYITCVTVQKRNKGQSWLLKKNGPIFLKPLITNQFKFDKRFLNQLIKSSTVNQPYRFVCCGAFVVFHATSVIGNQISDASFRDAGA